MSDSVCVYAGVCMCSALTMQCTDKGERDSALPVPLMNDPTFVLVTRKNLEGRTTAQNNAALVLFVCNPSISKLILGNSYP